MSTNLKKSSATQSRKRDGPKERLKQTVKDCLERYQHWQKLYEDGGSDPFYTDGANLALVRNHIIYYKKQMEEVCLALACELPDVYFRALPPEVPAGYMAKPDEIRQAAGRPWLRMRKMRITSPCYGWGSSSAQSRRRKQGTSPSWAMSRD